MPATANSLSSIIRQRAAATPFDPSLREALDAIRLLNDVLIHEVRGRYVDASDALAVLDNYVYRHATSDDFRALEARRHGAAI